MLPKIYVTIFFHAINFKNIHREQSNIAIFSFINQIYREKTVDPELKKKKKKDSLLITRDSLSSTHPP